MSKRAFIATAIILSILCIFGVYASSVQAQGPPLIPPHGIWGESQVDGVPLDQSDTDYTISVKMVRLLIIFLHAQDDQPNIDIIVSQLDSGTTTALQQAFLDSEYCQSRTPATVLSPTASVAVQTAGDEWLVNDGVSTYTVIRKTISVWDTGLETWVSGSRLEVYEHNGLIASYTMGDLPTDYYVLQIPMNSNDILWGNNTFVLREAGTAVVGEDAYIYINDIPITDPSGPYIITADAFVGMTINAPSMYQFSIEFIADWNLFSLPVQPLNTDPGVVLQNLAGEYNSVWAYNRDTGGWDTYVPGRPVNSLDELVAGVGYWILMNVANTLEVEGLMPDTAIVLKPEWNLVGYNSLIPRLSEQCMASVAEQINSVWAQNQGTGGWYTYVPGRPVNSLNEMGPGVGYWIKSDALVDIIWDIEE